ncbi:hypothetical protein GCM10010381_24920 [Streptomyces xantholiticus]|nr:hypothetical protein GCM10010381_24920 [Streptomyces xantholiticus]
MTAPSTGLLGRAGGTGPQLPHYAGIRTGVLTERGTTGPGRRYAKALRERSQHRRLMPWTADCPTHLHIELLNSFQGGGIGEVEGDPGDTGKVGA